MANCTSCGITIPEEQGGSCSMCFGDIDHGTDGYYRECMEELERQEANRQLSNQQQQEQQENENN